MSTPSKQNPTGNKDISPDIEALQLDLLRAACFSRGSL